MNPEETTGASPQTQAQPQVPVLSQQPAQQSAQPQGAPAPGMPAAPAQTVPPASVEQPRAIAEYLAGQPAAAVSNPVSTDAAVSPVTPLTQQVVPEPEAPAASSAVPSQPAAERPAAAHSALPQPQPLAAAPTTEPFKVKKPRSKKRKLLLAGAAIVIVLGLAVGGVFGLYLPNTPSAVWNTGLERTGKALDTLTQDATTAEKLKTYKTSNMTGTVKAKVGDNSYEGTLTSAFDDKHTDAKLTFNMQEDSQPAKQLTVNFLSELTEDTTYPNVYFQMAGLKTLGLETFSPNLLAYDTKWINITAEDIKSLTEMYATDDVSSDTTQKAKTDRINDSDVRELATAVSRVTADKLFASDEDSAVFIRKELVGKETVDGISTYHYKAAINKAHAKAYCTEVQKAVYDTSAFKKLSDQTDAQISEVKADAGKRCDEALKELKDSYVIDVWMDRAYKLLYKIRFPDDSDKNTYFEIGQRYTGGDDLTVFGTIHDDENKIDGSLSIKTNSKTNKTELNATAKGGEEDAAYDVSIGLTSTPSDKAVSITRPKDAVPFSTLMQDWWAP